MRFNAQNRVYCWVAERRCQDRQESTRVVVSIQYHARLLGLLRLLVSFLFHRVSYWKGFVHVLHPTRVGRRSDMVSKGTSVIQFPFRCLPFKNRKFEWLLHILLLPSGLFVPSATTLTCSASLRIASIRVNRGPRCWIRNSIDDSWSAHRTVPSTIRLSFHPARLNLTQIRFGSVRNSSPEDLPRICRCWPRFSRNL